MATSADNSEKGIWPGIDVVHASRLRQEVCQYSMRPRYSRPVLDHSTRLHQGMMGQILATLHAHTRIPNVRIAECVSAHSAVRCQGRDVPAFLRGDHSEITTTIFTRLIEYIVCGSEPEGNLFKNELRNIACDIHGFFIHPNERDKIPAFFFAPRAFAQSPFDGNELAMAIHWMRREASQSKLTGVLAFTSYDDIFPQQQNKEVMAATRKLLAEGAIRVEFLFPTTQSVARHTRRKLSLPD